MKLLIHKRLESINKYLKICVLHLLCFICFGLYGQESVLSFSKDSISLIELIENVEWRAGVLFSYKPADLEGQSISIDRSFKDLDEFFAYIKKETGLDFTIVSDNYVAISRGVINQPKRITVSGIIKDEESGVPLSFANVYVKEVMRGTQTDENGNFELELVEGEELTISYVSYGEKVIPFSELEANPHLSVSLSYAHFSEEFLVIKDYLADGVDLKENGLSTSINIDRLQQLPGEAEVDVLKTIQFLPGVKSPSSGAGDIHIRGCLPDQNLIIWDEIPIYHSAHYFGMISAIDPFIIDEMNVYRGGFGAEYGGRIGSVIELQTKGLESTRPNFGVGSNMTHAYTFGHQKLGASDSTSISYSVRRSFADVLETPTLDNYTKIVQQGFLIGNKEVDILPNHIRRKSDINFLDSHFKFDTYLSKKSRLSFSLLGVRNEFTGEIVDDQREERQDDTMMLDSWGGSLIFNTRWNKKFDTKVSIVNARYAYDYSFELRRNNRNKATADGQKVNEIINRELAVRNTLLTSNTSKLNFGYHLLNYDISYDIRYDGNQASNVKYVGDDNANIHNIYADFQKQFSIFSLTLGQRLGYYDMSEDFYFEPRLNLTARIDQSLSLHAYYGKHYQYVSQISGFQGNRQGINFSIWALSSLNAVPVQESEMIQMGGIWSYKGWVIDLQAYQRQVSGLSTRTFDFDFFRTPEDALGRAYIKGLDLLVKKRIRNIQSWLSYSYSITDFEFLRIIPERFSSEFDQRHVFQWSNLISISNLQMGFNYSVATGLPYTRGLDFRQETDNDGNTQFVTIFGRPFGRTLRENSELNISAAYTFQRDNSRCILALSVTNLLDNENIYQRNYYVDTPQGQVPTIDNQDKTNLRRTFNVSIRYEWH